MSEQTFWTNLADIPLRIEVRYPFTWDLFADYQVIPTADEQQQYRMLALSAGLDPDQPLRVSDAEIQREQNYPPEAPNGFSAGYLESLAIYRKICSLLLSSDVLLFHCSALALDHQAFLFSAPSGTGKSTHTRLWRNLFGARVQMINDDKPLLRRQADGSWRVYGTPYGGKDNLQENISCPVGGIVMLSQGKENRIRPLSMREAYPLLLAQTYIDQQNPAALMHTMDLVGGLARLPIYQLECTISEEAVRMAYRALKGENA